MTGPLRTAAQALAGPPLSLLSRTLKAGRGTIFFLHRFPEPADPEQHDPRFLHTLLAECRRRDYELLSLGTMLDCLESGASSLSRSIAFTVDDGYADFFDAAVPVFEHFDCPVTMFLTTGFIDGRLWMWWDRLRFMLESTDATSLSLDLGDSRFEVEWADAASRETAILTTFEVLKTIPEWEMPSRLEEVGEIVGVTPPQRPPDAYAPMTWDQVRRLASRGVRFGPHTVSHPILSRTSDEVSADEISTSWRRLREETDALEPIFCYPNGKTGDFSEREIATLKDLGLRGAVTCEPGYAVPKDMRGDQRFALPRFALPSTVSRSMRIITGVDRLRRAFPSSRRRVDRRL